MKRLLFILLLFVNLQIVIKSDYVGLELKCLTADAQRQTREAGDNCFMDGLWYNFADYRLCDTPAVVDAYKCDFCGMGFEKDKDAHDAHELICPDNPINQHYDDPWSTDDGSGTDYGTGSSGTGGSGGSGGGNAGGTGNNSDKYKQARQNWGEYVPGQNERVCVPFLPKFLPPQETKMDCLPTALVYHEVLLNPNMSKNDFDMIKGGIIDDLLLKAKINPYQTGIDSPLSVFLLNLLNIGSSLSVESSYLQLACGKPLLGIIQWDSGGRHAAVIYGYDVKTGEFLCIDPFYGYKSYKTTQFKYIYQKK